jgi:hypothetical protein
VSDKKIKTMSMEQTLKLSAWFSTSAEWLKGTHPTYPEVADRASRELGFEVTPTNVKSVNEAMGGFFTSHRVSSILSKSDRFRRAIEEVMVPLLARIQELEDVVTRIAKGLGEKPPRGSGAENLRVVPPSAANRK